MADAPYTHFRQAQYRGPSTSDDYNQRVEEGYKDLMVLYNRSRLAEADLAELYRRVVQDLIAMARKVGDLEDRVYTEIEGPANRLTFHSAGQIEDPDFFDAPFAISATSRLTNDAEHGLLLLPRVDVSSLSKLYFTNNEGDDIIPPTLETRVSPVLTSADSGTATIDSSEPELAVLRRPGRIWERNVIATADDPDGAIVNYYLKVPTDLFTTDKSNVLIVHPYPVFGTDIMEVATTSLVDPLLSNADNYVLINATGMHSGNDDAKGWVAPGSWNDDIAYGAGPKAYYFDPKVVTAIRLKLRTTHYLQEGGKYIYAYGLSRLDLRYDKFLATGKAMIRFDAPEGETISQITDVQPQIWNVVGAAWDEVFSYRVIWETSAGSGEPTLSEQPNSQRVWIEVTLNQTTSKGTPALSGLVVSYT